MNQLWSEIDMLREEMQALLEHYKQGVVKPQIDSFYTFQNAAEGHRRMQNRENVGKIVFTPK